MYTSPRKEKQTIKRHKKENRLTTDRLIVGAGLGDAELVVGDDPEVVGGLRVEVLVADGVVLHGAAARPDLSLPFIHV